MLFYIIMFILNELLKYYNGVILVSPANY